MNGRTARASVYTSVVLFLWMSHFTCYSAKGGGGPASGGPSSTSPTNSSQGQNQQNSSQSGSQGSAGSLSVGPNILSYEAQDQIGQDIGFEIGELNKGTILVSDLLDVPAIADSLASPKTALLSKIQKHLKADTKKAIRKCHANRAYAGLAACRLARDFNSILEGPSIYDPATCSAKAQQAVSAFAKPEGQTITKINRLVLEDAFGNNIQHCSFLDTPIKDVLLTTTYPNLNNELLLYAYVNDEISDLKTKLDTDDKNFAGGGGAHGFLPTTAQDTITAVTQLLAIFTTATTMSSANVVTNELGIIPGVLTGLKKEGVNAQFIDLGLDTSFISDPNSLFAKLKDVATLRAQAQVLLNKYPQQVPDPNNPGKMIDNVAYKNLQGYQKDALGDLSATSMAYDSFYTNIVMTNINGLLGADYYNVKVVNDGTGALLVLRSLYAGGDSRTKSNPFVNLFTDGPRFSYVGGAAAAYVLIGGKGNVILARDARNFAGFKELSDSPDYDIHNNMLMPPLAR